MQDLNMYRVAETLLREHGARMTRSHKSEFREFVIGIANSMGYNAKVENCYLTKNVVVGNPEKAEIILTAHYDTPPNLPFNFVKKQVVGFGVGTLSLMGVGLFFSELALNSGSPEMIEVAVNFAKYFSLIPAISVASSGALGLYSMGFLGGENKNNYDDNTSGVLTLIALMNYYKDLILDQKDRIAFVFTDDEEKGLVGSLEYRFKHFKPAKKQMFINYDCVGVGKNVNVFHTGNEKGSIIDSIAEGFYETISRAGYTFSVKKSTIKTVSDHYSFVGTKGNVTILCDNKGDPVTNHIHGKKDCNLDLQKVAGIAEMSAVAIDNLMGFEHLNRRLFNFEGKFSPEKLQMK